MFLAFKMCIVSRPVRLPVLWGRLGRVWAADPDAAEDLSGGGRGRGDAGVQGAAPGGHGAHVETGEGTLPRDLFCSDEQGKIKVLVLMVF